MLFAQIKHLYRYKKLLENKNVHFCGHFKTLIDTKIEILFKRFTTTILRSAHNVFDRMFLYRPTLYIQSNLKYLLSKVYDFVEFL